MEGNDKIGRPRGEWVDNVVDNIGAELSYSATDKWREIIKEASDSTGAEPRFMIMMMTMINNCLS